jgi:uncharacterized protein (DUF2235 family)
MPKRIVLCFDGTWNTPGNAGDLQDVLPLLEDHDIETTADTSLVETNVCRMYRSILKSGTSIQQIKWYDRGVGTNWYDRLPGGVSGVGLSRNIREGYKFLSDNYDDGDDVFIFGFSRGAYTARSLVGLVRSAGLLPKGSLKKKLVDANLQLIEAYELYRTRGDSVDSVRALNFRQKHGSRLIEIKFLGVWDTVGALGIPLQPFGEFNKTFFDFHDTELSRLVRNAFHAIAVDEHREPFAPTLWQPKEKLDQVIEQRWFIGAHCDVGGGYEDRRLSDLTLLWIQQKAKECGLELDVAGIPTTDADRFAGTVHDSYLQFLGGLFHILHKRFLRSIGMAGEFSNEIVDATVRDRRAKDLTYRPRNPGL